MEKDQEINHVDPNRRYKILSLKEGNVLLTIDEFPRLFEEVKQKLEEVLNCAFSQFSLVYSDSEGIDNTVTEDDDLEIAIDVYKTKIFKVDLTLTKVSAGLKILIFDNRGLGENVSIGRLGTKSNRFVIHDVDFAFDSIEENFKINKECNALLFKSPDKELGIQDIKIQCNKDFQEVYQLLADNQISEIVLFIESFIRIKIYKKEFTLTEDLPYAAIEKIFKDTCQKYSFSSSDDIIHSFTQDGKISILSYEAEFINFFQSREEVHVLYLVNKEILEGFKRKVKVIDRRKEKQEADIKVYIHHEGYFDFFKKALGVSKNDIIFEKIALQGKVMKGKISSKKDFLKFLAENGNKGELNIEKSKLEKEKEGLTIEIQASDYREGKEGKIKIKVAKGDKAGLFEMLKFKLNINFTTDTIANDKFEPLNKDEAAKEPAIKAAFNSAIEDNCRRFIITPKVDEVQIDKYNENMKSSMLNKEVNPKDEDQEDENINAFMDESIYPTKISSTLNWTDYNESPKKINASSYDEFVRETGKESLQGVEFFSKDHLGFKKLIYDESSFQSFINDANLIDKTIETDLYQIEEEIDYSLNRNIAVSLKGTTDSWNIQAVNLKNEGKLSIKKGVVLIMEERDKFGECLTLSGLVKEDIPSRQSSIINLYFRAAEPFNKKVHLMLSEVIDGKAEPSGCKSIPISVNIK